MGAETERSGIIQVRHVKEMVHLRLTFMPAMRDRVDLGGHGGFLL